jgi:hypothetical protein
MRMKQVSQCILIFSLINLWACSARIGVPISAVEGEHRKHPVGTILIIETHGKTKVGPRLY